MDEEEKTRKSGQGRKEQANREKSRQKKGTKRIKERKKEEDYN